MTVPVDESHDPALRSWVESANRGGTDFPIQNLPFGVFTRPNSGERCIGVAIGDEILDARRVVHAGLAGTIDVNIREALEQPTLNRLMALGHDAMATLRRALIALLRSGSRTADPRLLVAADAVRMHLPATIGDYTDFYASVHHATRVGRLFRPDNPLLPNYKHVPIAYHGRASSIVPSGTPIRRPHGQVKPPDGSAPVFQSSRSLDYELEVGIFIGQGNAIGTPIPVAVAEDHAFGVCLMNDWSARDIQSWESQPLGPFLSKNFATTISPWVVTLEALAPFRCPPDSRAAGDPAPLPYLTVTEQASAVDLQLEAWLSTAQSRKRGDGPYRLTTTLFRSMYWSMAQLIAHHTSGGCNLRPGDLLGSGTTSGPGAESRACLLEITSNGRDPLVLPNGEQRTFLNDGDEVALRGCCEREGWVRIGFGECRGAVLGAAGP